jgi:hypothetical protein
MSAGAGGYARSLNSRSGVLPVPRRVRSVWCLASSAKRACGSGSIPAAVSSQVHPKKRSTVSTSEGTRSPTRVTGSGKVEPPSQLRRWSPISNVLNRSWTPSTSRPAKSNAPVPISRVRQEARPLLLSQTVGTDVSWLARQSALPADVAYSPHVAGRKCAHAGRSERNKLDRAPAELRPSGYIERSLTTPGRSGPHAHARPHALLQLDVEVDILAFLLLKRDGDCVRLVTAGCPLPTLMRHG